MRSVNCKASVAKCVSMSIITTAFLTKGSSLIGEPITASSASLGDFNNSLVDLVYFV